MHNRNGSLPPGNFTTPQKPNMLSPSAVVAGARNDINFPNSCTNAGEAKRMLFTQQYGELGGFQKSLEVIGQKHKNNAWANPANTAKNKIAGELTVRDVVDNVLRIPAFGF